MYTNSQWQQLAAVTITSGMREDSCEGKAGDFSRARPCGFLISLLFYLPKKKEVGGLELDVKAVFYVATDISLNQLWLERNILLAYCPLLSV